MKPERSVAFLYHKERARDGNTFTYLVYKAAPEQYFFVFRKGPQNVSHEKIDYNIKNDPETSMFFENLEPIGGGVLHPNLTWDRDSRDFPGNYPKDILEKFRTWYSQNYSLVCR